MSSGHHWLYEAFERSHKLHQKVLDFLQIEQAISTAQFRRLHLPSWQWTATLGRLGSQDCNDSKRQNLKSGEAIH